MKILKYISVISLGLVITSAPILAQKVEPELEQLLADNPDILGAKPTNAKDKQLTLEPTTPAKTPEDTSPEREKAKIQAITEEFNSIFDTYLFLGKTTSLNQTELSNLKLLVDHKIANIKSLADFGTTSRLDYAPWYAQRLSEVIYWFKFACLNLEALSVSSEDSKVSVLQEPLDFAEMQKAKLKIFGSLIDTGRIHPMAYPEKSVRSIIFKSLPSRLQSSLIQYVLCGITQSSAQAYYLSKILSQNFYAEKVVLSEEYFEIISTFYKAQKLGGQLDVDSFLNKIEEAINAFATDRASMQTSGKNSSSNLILELLLTKLIKIKNDVVKFYKPALNFKDNQEKAELLIRHKLFLESKKYELLYSNKQFCEFFNLYCTFLQDFFANKLQPQVADRRLFELECLLADLIIMTKSKLKQNVETSKIELVKQLIIKYVLELDAKDPALTALVDMGKILETARGLINKDLKVGEKGFFASIKDAIFSGNWIDSGKFKGVGAGTAQTMVDFLEYAFDRKFENFKEAAFFLLARTSPVLAAGLIYKIMPYLSGDLQEKASKVIGESGLTESKAGVSETEQDASSAATPKQTEPAAAGNGTSGNRTPDDNKIFDFVSRNPEIFNKLCEVKPELINALAATVERRLIKAKS